ncbi:rhodanese-like domain-containing protein [Desulforegula conservatrix]|uniref:rhodanese-like domain-containing protein n=1 Tax=Desulforegula conservatrix TaxID=153026 RepID=UPI000402A49E|nr:rhodanese-like domain-containing protein [Desulforegula conservatrix]
MKRFSRIITIIAATACVFIATGAVYANEFSKQELTNEEIAVNFYNEVKRGGYEVVNTAELKKWIDEKKDIILVDTMPLESSYKKNHLPKALQMEFPIPEMTEIKPDVQDALVKLLGVEKNKTIVFYCGFPKCTRSHNAAMWAKKLGYTNVYRYPGGIKAWMESGFPVEP